MKKHLLFIVFFVYNITNAQLSFSSQTMIMENINATPGATSIINADIDGDGDLDLLSGDISNVKWFENVGGNNDQLISHTLADFGAKYCYFEDIDNDGDKDVIFSGQLNTSGIYWIENLDGLGNFTNPVLLANASTIHTIFIIDFDFDNDLDILYSYSSFNTFGINLLQNNGVGGNFTNIPIPQSSNARGFYALDIDNDNDIDIFSLDNNTQKIERLTNQGMFNFTSQIIANGRDNGYGTIQFADIDNDNDPDLIFSDSDIYSNSLEEIKIYKNDGLGNLSFHTTLITNGISLSYLLLEDLDQDNDLDIIITSAENNYVAWYRNEDGLGNYGNLHNINTNLYDAKAVCAFDFDGDNDIDIIATSKRDDKIIWHENLNGLGNFGLENILTKSINNPIKTIVADIDGDSKNDVIVFSASDGKVSWHKNLNGQGDFGEQNFIASDLISVTNGLVVDLDGDGDLDIVTGEDHSNTNSRIVWYENLDGQGNFGPQHLIRSYNGITGLASGDFDNDGDNDLIYTSSWSNHILSWYKNDGQGNFTYQGIPMTESIGYGSQVIVKDINNDGNLDFIVDYLNTLYWFSNDGNGNFTKNNVGASFYAGTSFDVEDLDGDGDMDFVSSSLATYNGVYKIIWFENLDGQGNFGPIKIIEPGFSTLQYNPEAFKLKLKDLDSDGDLDLVGSFDFDGMIIWYENLDGKGNFSTKETIINETGRNFKYTDFVDINNDGYLDIIGCIINDGYTITTKNDQVVHYINLGPSFNKINGFVRFGLNVDDCNLPTNNLKIITSNGTNTIETFTTNNGYYQFYVDPDTYTTTIPTTLGHFNISDPTEYNTTFTGIGNIQVANFCLYPSETVNDLNIVIIPLSEARPGFNSRYQIIYTNVGTTQLSGNVTVNFDNSKVTFITSSITPNSITNNSLSFEYLTLSPFETKIIDLDFNIFTPPTVEINETLLFSASITPNDNDFTEEDNTYVLNQIVIGSFDPNDITCLEGDKIFLEETTKYLHYIIRFQNTGTASAINVKIENILDDKLDWSTFQIINSSHDNRVEIKNGNIVTFIHDNINLPHSAANETLSNGFVAYKIKPKANVGVGDLFSNTANIFFDYNLPITTNTALTEIIEKTENNTGNETNTFHFYPVPVSNILTIEAKAEILKIEILNDLGQVLISNSNQNSINILSLSSGLYFCRVTDINNTVITKKIIKN